MKKHSLHLSSIFKENQIDIEETVLLRHTLNREEARRAWELGLFEDYQSLQDKDGKPVKALKSSKYIASFLGNGGTEAIFLGMYKITGKLKTAEEIEEKIPSNYPKESYENYVYFVTEKLNVMSDLEEELVIDWGKATNAYAQYAGKQDKAVIAISNRDEIEFPGYENLIVDWNVLGALVNRNSRYRRWIEALENVNGIYLICDKEEGKQYIGSTYNDDGILGRWTVYYNTHDGEDDGIKEHLEKHENAYKNFQFSILQILPKNVAKEEAIRVESIYKKKLCTRNTEYGLNKN